jgi:hypothetical protein
VPFCLTLLAAQIPNGLGVCAGLMGSFIPELLPEMEVVLILRHGVATCAKQPAARPNHPGMFRDTLAPSLCLVLGPCPGFPGWAA